MSDANALPVFLIEHGPHSGRAPADGGAGARRRSPPDLPRRAAASVRAGVLVLLGRRLAARSAGGDDAATERLLRLPGRQPVPRPADRVLGPGFPDRPRS